MTSYPGLMASPGIAIGPVMFVDRAPGDRVSAATRRHGRNELEAAIAARIAELKALMDRLDTVASDVLAFQIEMLRDPALYASAFAAIDRGGDAAASWRDAFTSDIVGYKDSAREYFRARAADLEDIRNGVLQHLEGQVERSIPPGSIVFGDELSPSRFLSSDWTAGGGVVLRGGSAAGHVGVLARSMGVPMLINVRCESGAVGGVAILDADAGCVVFGAGDEALARARVQLAKRHPCRSSDPTELLRPAMTADGVPVAVMLNISSLDELTGLSPQCCDGIGLVRTEFLFDGVGLPNEDSQYLAYAKLLRWAAPRHVVIRVLDCGGDKPLSGLTSASDTGSFLGARGIRLLLRHPAIFKIQLRALARAAGLGNLSILLPMVTSPRELAAAQSLLNEATTELAAEGREFSMPPLGIMVEVPATAMLIGRFALSDGFSIGTNDLVQYVSAAARDIAESGPLQEDVLPAVLELIGRVVRVGRDMDRPVSLCGDLASEPGQLEALLQTGLRTLSVPPSKLGEVKRAIGRVRLSR